MNFTTVEALRLILLRHSIIAIHESPIPWVKPWWPSLRTIARVVTCASFIAPLRRCFLFRSILQAGNMQNVPSLFLSRGAWAACRALVPVRPMRSMRWVCRPMQRFPLLFFTVRDRKLKPLFVGKSGPRAGPDVSSIQRNLFLYTQFAPTQ